MKKIKKIIPIVSIVFVVLAMACLYVGIQRISNIRPVSDYEDMGIYEFVPYRSLPTTIKNNATGRQKRMNPTKTVYSIYYKTINNTTYQWIDKVTHKSEAKDRISEGKRVTRRILSIKENKNYIVIDDKYTASSYVSSQQRLYKIMIISSIVYLMIYLITIIIIKRRKKFGVEI